MIEMMDVVDIDPETIVAQHGCFVMTSKGIIVTGEPDYDEWSAATSWAQKVEKHSPWWVVDLIKFGEAKFGEKYTQAIEVTGKAAGTLMNSVWVGEKIPIERRHEKLSFAHHQEVAALPPEEQDQWLDKAEIEDLSSKQLRQHISVAKAVASGKTIELWISVKCTDVDDQQLLLSKFHSEGRSAHAHTKEVKDV